MRKKTLDFYLLICLVCLLPLNTKASDEEVKIQLQQSKKVSPVRYGFHYEEIGMLGEGGLHAELVRNRGFEEANPPKNIAVKNGFYETENPTGENKQVFHVDPLIGWQVTPFSYSPIKIERTLRTPLNEQNPHSMLVNVTDDFVAGDTGVAIHNTGFFGMNVVKGNGFHLSFYSKSNGYKGKLKFHLSDDKGRCISDVKEFEINGTDWLKQSATLTANNDCKRGMLTIVPDKTGRFQLDMVSMYPADTWDNGKSIFRKDIMQNFVDYRPDFLRFPGGCVVHGINEATMYHWKETIGDISKRPGAWSKWAPYYRTDGLGYHEFYQLCEYLGCDAMYVTPTGMVCTEWAVQTGRHTFKHPDSDIDFYVKDVLDAIEYAIGPVDSKWGSERAKNGHPAVFPLKYVEVGNEDFGTEYYKRYDRMASAIHERYPQLTIIANAIIFKDEQDKRKYLADFKNQNQLWVYDEHYYADVDWAKDTHYKFDSYNRKGPDIFIGELGISGRYPKNLLAEGIVKLSLERNGDMHPLMADRPLMRNYDFLEGRKMTPVMLHNTSSSIKTFNYYMCKMMRDNKINICYASDVKNQKDVYITAGSDQITKDMIVKIINLSDSIKNIRFDIVGLKQQNIVTITELKAEEGQYNTPVSPDVIKPVTTMRKMSFPINETLPANSFRIYRIKQ